MKFNPPIKLDKDAPRQETHIYTLPAKDGCGMGDCITPHHKGKGMTVDFLEDDYDGNGNARIIVGEVCEGCASKIRQRINES